MRKQLLLVCAAMLAFTTSAHAVGGIDISTVACPGNAGALGNLATIDCASGAGIIILGTWSPAENIADLTNLDGTFYLYTAAGFSNAAFWDFDAAGCNFLALSSSQARPTSGCTTPVAYTATWSLAGSGTAIAAGRNPTGSNNRIIIPFTCYRPGLLSVTTSDHLFGVQVIVDGSTATEAGGTCAGCSQNVSIGWSDAFPGAATMTPTALFAPTGNFPGFGQCMGVGATPNCVAVPTVKRTWGQLKALYR